MTDSLRYLYAVTRGVSDADVETLTGVEDAPVRLLDVDDLTAVVSEVDRAVFEAAALEQRLDDLTWLATTARAHHHVVDAVGRRATVAPLALATVYFDDDRVRALLQAGHDDLVAALDRLEGRSEFGLKAWARSGAAAGDATERPASGAEYLRRRRAALNDQRQGVDDATRAAEDVYERAGALVVESRRHRLQEASLTGSEERQVLNGAHLAEASQAEALREFVEGLRDHPRLRVEMTGPWVPYSFVRLTGGEGVDDAGTSR